jgi:hypothetical protein
MITHQLLLGLFLLIASAARAAEPQKTYSIQVGSYTSQSKAAFVQSMVKNLAPARVDKVMP